MFLVNVNLLLLQEFKVPDGFCLTTRAFDCHIKVISYRHYCLLLI